MSTSYPIGDPQPQPFSEFVSGGCVYPQQTYQYWVPPQTTETTVTEVCEYDEDGKLVRKTVTTKTVTQGGYLGHSYTSNSPHIYGTEVMPCSG